MYFLLFLIFYVFFTTSIRSSFTIPKVDGSSMVSHILSESKTEENLSIGVFTGDSIT